MWFIFFEYKVEECLHLDILPETYLSNHFEIMFQALNWDIILQILCSTSM